MQFVVPYTTESNCPYAAVYIVDSESELPRAIIEDFLNFTEENDELVYVVEWNNPSFQENLLKDPEAAVADVLESYGIYIGSWFEV